MKTKLIYKDGRLITFREGYFGLYMLAPFELNFDMSNTCTVALCQIVSISKNLLSFKVPLQWV
jgi:hypothetical protein